MTDSPRLRAARASARPSPVEQPVISQVAIMVGSFRQTNATRPTYWQRRFQVLRATCHLSASSFRIIIAFPTIVRPIIFLKNQVLPSISKSAPRNSATRRVRADSIHANGSALGLRLVQEELAVEAELNSYHQSRPWSGLREDLT